MKKKILIIGIAVGIIGSCTFYQKTHQKNNQKADDNLRTFILDNMDAHYKELLSNDDFSLTGKFLWSFHLGPAQQSSFHSFDQNHIDYRMTGKIYSTDYRMYKLSYDNSDKKWIGQTPDGTVYVLFFKDINHSTVSIYKHKCEQGISEAITFARPTYDETKDHGWNVYTQEGLSEQEDTLTVNGIFYNDTQSIDLQDEQVVYQNKTYQKLTHHTGEKRWVGQLDKHYLVVFYQHNTNSQDNTKNNIQLSTQIFDDLELAYKAKHDEQSYHTFIAK